jgi:hypothetical protein
LHIKDSDLDEMKVAAGIVVGGILTASALTVAEKKMDEKRQSLQTNQQPTPVIDSQNFSQKQETQQQDMLDKPIGDINSISTEDRQQNSPSTNKIGNKLSGIADNIKQQFGPVSDKIKSIVGSNIDNLIQDNNSSFGSKVKSAAILTTGLVATMSAVLSAPILSASLGFGIYNLSKRSKSISKSLASFSKMLMPNVHIAVTKLNQQLSSKDANDIIDTNNTTVEEHIQENYSAKVQQTQTNNETGLDEIIAKLEQSMKTPNNATNNTTVEEHIQDSSSEVQQTQTNNLDKMIKMLGEFIQNQKNAPSAPSLSVPTMRA